MFGGKRGILMKRNSLVDRCVDSQKQEVLTVKKDWMVLVWQITHNMLNSPLYNISKQPGLQGDPKFHNSTCVPIVTSE